MAFFYLSSTMSRKAVGKINYDRSIGSLKNRNARAKDGRECNFVNHHGHPSKLYSVSLNAFNVHKAKLKTCIRGECQS